MEKIKITKYVIKLYASKARCRQISHIIIHN